MPRSQPRSSGSPEKPYPGKEGSTRWKASSALPPCAVGSVSGPTESIISSERSRASRGSMITGSAFSFDDLTWMKWTSTPSISVMNCGKALSFASALRQSYSVVQ